MGKANRRKGSAREKFRFGCDGHDTSFRAPLRFNHEDARKDWNGHNIIEHLGKKTDMTSDEAILLLSNQRIEGAPTGPPAW